MKFNCMKKCQTLNQLTRLRFSFKNIACFGLVLQSVKGLLGSKNIKIFDT